VVAPSHQDMERRSHTIRSTAIPSTGRGTGPVVFGATAAPGAAGTAITGPASVGTADMEVDMEVDMEAGEDMAAEAGMAAAETFP
jgi:hypothetical protein